MLIPRLFFGLSLFRRRTLLSSETTLNVLTLMVMSVKRFIIPYGEYICFQVLHVV